MSEAEISKKPLKTRPRPKFDLPTSTTATSFNLTSPSSFKISLPTQRSTTSALPQPPSSLQPPSAQISKTSSLNSLPSSSSTTFTTASRPVRSSSRLSRPPTTTSRSKIPSRLPTRTPLAIKKVSSGNVGNLGSSKTVTVNGGKRLPQSKSFRDEESRMLIERVKNLNVGISGGGGSGGGGKTAVGGNNATVRKGIAESSASGRTNNTLFLPPISEPSSSSLTKKRSRSPPSYLNSEAVNPIMDLDSPPSSPLPPLTSSSEIDPEEAHMAPSPRKKAKRSSPPSQFDNQSQPGDLKNPFSQTASSSSSNLFQSTSLANAISTSSYDISADTSADPLQLLPSPVKPSKFPVQQGTVKKSQPVFQLPTTAKKAGTIKVERKGKRELEGGDEEGDEDEFDEMDFLSPRKKRRKEVEVEGGDDNKEENGKVVKMIGDADVDRDSDEKVEIAEKKTDEFIGEEKKLESIRTLKPTDSKSDSKESTDSLAKPQTLPTPSANQPTIDKNHDNPFLSSTSTVSTTSTSNNSSDTSNSLVLSSSDDSLLSYDESLSLPDVEGEGGSPTITLKTYVSTEPEFKVPSLPQPMPTAKIPIPDTPSDQTISHKMPSETADKLKSVKDMLSQFGSSRKSLSVGVGPGVGLIGVGNGGGVSRIPRKEVGKKNGNEGKGNLISSGVGKMGKFEEYEVEVKDKDGDGALKKSFSGTKGLARAGAMEAGKKATGLGVNASRKPPTSQSTSSISSASTSTTSNVPTKLSKRISLPTPISNLTNLPVSDTTTSSCEENSMILDEGVSTISLGNIVSEIGSQELRKSDCLKGLSCFVDVRTTAGDEAGGMFIDILKSLGAKVVLRPTTTLTHIIYKSGRPATLHRYRSHPDPKPLMVGVGWVLKSAELGKRANEEDFLVEVAKEEGLGKKRGKGWGKGLGGSIWNGNGGEEREKEEVEKEKRRVSRFAPKVGSPLAKKVLNLELNRDKDLEMDLDLDDI